MGTVVKARQITFDRIVAVKVLNAAVNTDDGRARFEREALALCNLHHRNTITFHGFGVHNGNPYMVMEYLPGVTLDTYLADQVFHFWIDFDLQQYAKLLAERGLEKERNSIIKIADELIAQCHQLNDEAIGGVLRDSKNDE